MRGEYGGDTYPPPPHPPTQQNPYCLLGGLALVPLLEDHDPFDSLFLQRGGLMIPTPLVHRHQKVVMTSLISRHRWLLRPLNCTYLCKGPFIKFSLITWLRLVDPVKNLRDMFLLYSAFVNKGIVTIAMLTPPGGRAAMLTASKDQPPCLFS